MGPEEVRVGIEEESAKLLLDTRKNFPPWEAEQCGKSYNVVNFLPISPKGGPLGDGT